MAFDSKYFTGTDSSSYFTESSNLYKSTQGLTIGDESGFGNNPLSSTQKAIMHGFQTLMIGMSKPGAGRGQEGLGNLDRITAQQMDATAEMLRLNKMNFSVHGPVVDLIGVSGEEGRERAISSEQREENLRLFEKTIENTDRIAQKIPDMKNTPITIHPVEGSLSEQGGLFDSGFKDNDGKIIYGKKGLMIKKDTGQIQPMQSSFKWLPIKDYKDIPIYELKKNTEANGFALFEVTPESHLKVANNTALDELSKRTTDAEIKMRQIERDTYGFNTVINDNMKNELMKNNAGYKNIGIELNSLKSDLHHLTSPKMGGGEGRNLFVKASDYANEVIPSQVSRLAMASYKTQTQPALAIENMYAGFFGTPQEVITLVTESRKKFARELEDKEGVDSDEAKKKANELIGITFDTGHLNTFKSKVNPATGKFWNDDDLKKEVEKMAKAGVKLVHIADNIGEFGKDSHLMIGRGNTKIDEMLDILKQNGFKSGQAAIESYEGEGDFDKVWARNNIRAMGSMYVSGVGPSFTDVDMSSQYSSRSSNYGHKVSDLHWSQWGGPFAGMQGTFRGGAGDKRDSFSETPTN